MISSSSFSLENKDTCEYRKMYLILCVALIFIVFGNIFVDAVSIRIPCPLLQDKFYQQSASLFQSRDCLVSVNSVAFL